MQTLNIKTQHKKLLADTVTPVSIYLKLRDKYENPFLLESSDYHGNENSFSYICCEPLARLSVKDGQYSLKTPIEEEHAELGKEKAQDLLARFSQSFQAEENPFHFINNGLFGYIGYDAVRYFEQIPVDQGKKDEYGIPDILYHVYRYVIAIDHFKNELYIFEHYPEGTEPKGLEAIENLVNNKNYPSYDFTVEGEETSNYTDEEFLDIIDQGMKHCMRGDVFQIVMSRRFQSAFHGDDFNVYRALRSINPSPYLFYFDFGGFKIFGSSPEAQIVIKDRKATIHPIAGTFKRTGNDVADAELAQKLHEDPKENAEHVMLVDLARNDLSRAGSDVEVATYKEVQYYSHVIHLVSKVTGKLHDEVSATQMVADTFPAGTLSGAPKVRAMQLINDNEKSRRGFYGGAIGFMGFNGDFNHAIMIRSFLSKNNMLSYQAGAGIVAKSNRESELEEVNNKLAALRRAIGLATELKG